MLPDSGSQLVAGYLASRLAYRIAQRQVALGVHPAIAAEHAERAANGIYSFWIGVVGLGGFWSAVVLLLATPWNFATFAWVAIGISIVVTIGARAYAFKESRGDVMLQYFFPTPALLVLGAFWTYIIGPVLVLASL